jgi:uncharacterized damage-inducible protein DinB
MSHNIDRLFEHVFWADTQVLALLDEQPAARTPEVLRYFAHVLAAERVWLLRLQGTNSSSQPVWPELSLEQIHELASANAEGYGRLLAELTESDLNADTIYSTSAGMPFRSQISDILLHVALHSSYHRGQIAAAVRAAGVTPVNTDFITFARASSS